MLKFQQLLLKRCLYRSSCRRLQGCRSYCRGGTDSTDLIGLFPFYLCLPVKSMHPPVEYRYQHVKKRRMTSIHRLTELRSDVALKTRPEAEVDEQRSYAGASPLSYSVGPPLTLSPIRRSLMCLANGRMTSLKTQGAA